MLITRKWFAALHIINYFLYVHIYLKASQCKFDESIFIYPNIIYISNFWIYFITFFKDFLIKNAL